MRKLSLLVVLLTSFGINAQIDEVRRITEELCSPEFHGRGYVHKGDSVAAEFLASEFKKLGIKPVKKRGYLQPFTISNVNAFPGEMSITKDGKELIPGKHYMVDPSSGASGEYPFKPFEIRGADMLEESSFTEKMSEFAAGGYTAIAFNFNDVSGDTLKSLKEAGIPASFANELPVIEVINTKFTWSVGRKQYKYPFIIMQDSVFNQESSYELGIDARLHESYASQNVVAYLPGKKKCGKTIVFTAHYDHLGRMGADGAYFPGANDNASGTAMLFTMAKYFKENPTKFNVMFIAFAGEEAGLEGSKYFVENPWLKLKDIRFLLNLDIMGSGEEGITAVNSTLFEEEFSLLQKINSDNQFLTKVKKRGPAANSDHYWFTEKGVPAFFIYTMGPNKHYHDVFDTYDELTFNEYEDITSLLVKFVEALEK